ncbi:hypothetical protein [Streptomyces odontomachi]|uniref:hypothetical protein n=1 Tax=Streptomyces odontomachi TaxID=2944940 RepID=UPI00210C7110|nr:hypothetical protein [Streptomyces sp. ODS25]
MDLDTLRYGKFESLGTAVADWAAMVKKLETLAKEAKDGLKGRADKADWKGSNATVSKEFITKTANEFADAHTEAGTVHNVLSDTHGELVRYQKQLQSAISDGLKKNLTVTDTGKGTFTVTMNIHPDRAAKGTHVPDHTVEDENALRDRVQNILKGATESDDSAAKVLDELMKQTPYGFSDASYKDRDTAAKAVEDAEKYADLIRKKGDDMSPEEFDRLNKILAAHKNDPLFQEKFATTLGPRGLLDFWADLADTTDGGVGRDRHDQLAEFQKNLGMTLAGATRSDSPAMQKWEDDMVKLGDDQLQTRVSKPYGFQVMSNLMRVGDWDDQYLDRYGNALVGMEKKARRAEVLWGSNMGKGLVPNLNFIGEDNGHDPMGGFMQALSNSPDESTHFFNEKQPNDNAQWVLKDRGVFDTTPQNTHDGNQTLEATGRALTAATTGINPNDPHPQHLPHTPEQRQALDRSLGILAGAGDDMHSEFRDDMARVLSNYGPEYIHSASAQYDDPNDPNLLDRHHLLEVTKQISRDGGSYAELNTGLSKDIAHYIATANPDDPKESLSRAGSTVGFMEQARYQALGTDKPDPTWKYRFISHGSGAVLNFIPEVGGPLGRGADLVTQAFQDDEKARIEQDHIEQTRQVFGGREKELHQMAELWKQRYPDEVGRGRDFDDYTLVKQINGDAYDANHQAKGLAGDN